MSPCPLFSWSLPMMSPASRSILSSPVSTITWVVQVKRSWHINQRFQDNIYACSDTRFPLISVVSNRPAIGVFLLGWKGSETPAHQAGGRGANASSPRALLNGPQVVLAAVTGPISCLSCPSLCGSTPEHSTSCCQEGHLHCHHQRGSGAAIWSRFHGWALCPQSLEEPSGRLCTEIG